MSTATNETPGIQVTRQLTGSLRRMGCSQFETREAFSIAAELDEQAERMARDAVADMAAAGVAMDAEHLALMSLFTALTARDNHVTLLVKPARSSIAAHLKYWLRWLRWRRAEQ